MFNILRCVLPAVALSMGFPPPAWSAEPCNPAAVRATTQAASRAEVLPDRQQRLAQQLAAQQFDAIALGDSIVSGWPPALLNSALGPQTLNAGFPSDGTEHVLWRLQTMDWSRQTPKRVLLLVGTNDTRFPSCAVAEGVTSVIRAIREKFPRAELIVSSILPRGQDMRAFEDTIAATNLYLAELARTERFRYLDMHDAMACGHITPCALFAPDNVHPSLAGYQVMTHLLTLLLRQG